MGGGGGQNDMFATPIFSWGGGGATAPRIDASVQEHYEHYKTSSILNILLQADSSIHAKTIQPKSV